MPFDGAAPDRPMPAPVRVVVAREIFAGRPELFELPWRDGLTLGYYLDDTGIDVPAGRTLNVQLVRGGTPGTRRVRTIGLYELDDTAVEPGDFVTVAVLPGKGGGKNPFRLLLSIASFALSFNLFGLPFLGSTLFSVGGFSLSVGQALGFALTLIGGLFAPKPKAPQQSAPDPQTYSLSGARNALEPFGAVPRLYGKRRIYPKLGAKIYTEIVGNDQYLNVLCNAGYAPMRLSEFKIGETPIEEFAGVEIETRGVVGTALRLSDGGGGAGRMSVPASALAPMKDASFTVEFRLTLHDGGSTGVRRDIVYKGKTASTCTFSAHLVSGQARRIGVMIGDGTTLRTVTGPDLELERAYQISLRWSKGGEAEEDGESAETTRRSFARGATTGSDRERPPKKPKPPPPPPPGRLALFVDGVFIGDSGDLAAPPVWDVGEAFAIEADNGVDFTIDDVRLWHKPRADAHIAFYSGTSLIGSEPNLTALFEFDHADTRDYSERRIGAGALTGSFSFETGLIHSNTPMTLFRNDVDEEPLAVMVKQVDEWVVRRSALGADEISIDVSFPQGLVDFDKEGDKKTATVIWEVQYREADAGGDWRNPVWIHQGEEGYEHLVAATGGTPSRLVMADAKAALVRRSAGFRPPARGQYDVRVRRVTEDNEDDSKLSDQSQWSALRSVTFRDPINMADVVKVALRIKASEQLNNVIDSLNFIAEAYLQVYDPEAGSWSLQLTRDAAWAYVDALTGPAAPNPLPFDRIDIPTFVSWAQDNAAVGRHFDFEFRSHTTTFEVLSTIAAAGRATFAMNGNRYSVARDVPQTVPVQQFTPHNSYDFKGEHLFLDRPHALRVKFVNAEVGYKDDERIVYMDGWDETTASRFQPIQIDGIVEPAVVFREARYYAATSILRPENYSWGCDLEHLVCRPGSLVNVVHFAASFGQASGRVKSATVESVQVDAAVPMLAGLLYGIRFRYQDGTLKDIPLAPKPLDGEYTILEFADPIDDGDVPAAGDLIATGRGSYVGEDMIVTRIVPRDEWRATIHGAPAAPQIHEIDDGPIPPWTSNLTPLPSVSRRPLPPSILKITSDETVIERLADGGLRSRIVLSLAPQSSSDALEPAEFEAEFRQQGAVDWTRAPKAIAGEIQMDLTPVTDGQAYEIRVRSVSRLGVSSPWATTTHTVVGQTTPPPSPGGLLVERLPNGLRRYRITPYDLPVDHAGWKFRWRAGSSLPSWTAGFPAHAGLWTADTFEAASFADRTFVVMVKAYDRGGRESANFVYAIVDLGDPVYDQIEETIDERDLGWPGEKEGCLVTGGDLVAESGELLYSDPSEPLYDAPGDLLFGGFGAMRYTAEFTPTLPGFLHLEWESNKSPTVAYRRAGDTPLIVNPDLPLIANPDAPFLPDSVWLPYQGPFGIEADQPVEVRISIPAGASQAELTALTAVIEAETEVEDLNDIEIEAAGTRLPIVKPFRRILGVGLTVQDDEEHDAVTARRIDLDAALGPLVKCFDASGAPTDGLVDATVRGVL